jgi:hypothetical protein
MDQRNGARRLNDHGRTRPRIYYSAGQSSNRAQMWGWFDLFILIILVTLVVTLVH